MQESITDQPVVALVGFLAVIVVLLFLIARYPLAAAAVVDADIGVIILYGSVVTLFGSLMGWLYARLAGPRITSPPSEEYRGQGVERPQGVGDDHHGHRPGRCAQRAAAGDTDGRRHR
ncbi:hypothetical protein [Streptomonospora wellingtoniae]|uniref:LapA family protein n=1 Tax=Streptomonospora wellingtoniae TaxID=3075544 RepID=A0ABU2L0V7_9ACTN|nr:hypothetical protein [Streptomonospora sp. DSM 45055]MDT0305178.1 hypothetical protein [Streptomonospora sp. DSM 45055]